MNMQRERYLKYFITAIPENKRQETYDGIKQSLAFLESTGIHSRTDRSLRQEFREFIAVYDKYSFNNASNVDQSAAIKNAGVSVFAAAIEG